MKYGVMIVIILFVGSTLAIGIGTLSRDSPPPGIEDKEEIQIGEYTFYYDEIDNSYSIFAKIANNHIYYDIPLMEATSRFAFRADPRNMQFINMDPEVVDKILSGNRIYLTYSPNEDNISKVVVAGIQIARLVGNVFGLRLTEAYTEDSDPINEMVPLKDCSDASDTVTVIQLETADTTEIVSEGNCVIVRGKDANELINAADKVGMNLLGIYL